VVHAGEWILKRLWDYGCSDTVSQGVPIGGGKVQIGHSNVIGIKRGTTRPDFHILVGGHYDSISDAIGVGINRAPGADDNASGTAAALEIARLLVDVELDASVQFVLFSAEEQGMIGSSQFVAQLVEEGVPPEELFFINMDMIGNSVSVPWMVKVFYDNPSRPLAELLAAVGDAYTDVTAIMSGFTGRSDHAPFWSAGYPALLLHERDFSPHYHSVHDLLEYLNMDYEAEVVKMVLATVLHLANAADPPDAVTAAETESGELHVEWSRSSDADVLGYHLEVLDEKGELTHKIFTKNTYAVLGPEDVRNGAVVRVRAEDVLGEGEASETVFVGSGGLVAASATPNPTGGPCRFGIFIPGSGPSVGISLRIVDASGRLVRSLNGGVLSRGAHTLDWDGTLADGSLAPSGVYFYEVEAEGIGRESGRIMVVR
jgi:hypothetical protein